MAPDYFMDCTEIEEIGDFIEGATLRSHDTWEQARLQSFIMARAFGCEAETAEEFMSLPWDEDEEVKDVEQLDVEALTKLREQAKEFEKSLKDG